MPFSKVSAPLLYCVCSVLLLPGNTISSPSTPPAASPRIVNIYNFVRNSDSRITNSQDVLFEATQQQIRLLKKAGLPATWALQYDALINLRYQKLFKEQLGPQDEIAAWWELPRPLVEKAGLKWRGRYDWDWAANVGFSPGYTPDERRKLVDVYMEDFRSIFGYYPRTVGSWYIDEVTLAYMVEKYGIVASCNCKDQVGTDGYTLWGGYWNQAYYPSRRNAYMPAQTHAGQIDVPVFRMLGSDPIYQHGTTPGLYSLEPVYRDSGGSSNWVTWFINDLVQQPSLAFAYTQAGQENSFGWEAMKTGLTRQVLLFAAEAKAGRIEVQTLAQTGLWFKKQFPLTPPTAVVALDDWRHENRKTVWYDSRFYRANLLWQDGAFFIRDLHWFDENLVSPTHDTALTTSSLAYYTLPIVDTALSSPTNGRPVGLWPVMLSSEGTASRMTPVGQPVVTESSTTILKVKQCLSGGGTLSLDFSEAAITVTGLDERGKTLLWAFDLVTGVQPELRLITVTSNSVSYSYRGTDYQLRLSPGTGSCQQLTNGDIRLSPNKTGNLALVPVVGFDHLLPRLR